MRLAILLITIGCLALAVGACCRVPWRDVVAVLLADVHALDIEVTRS